MRAAMIGVGAFVVTMLFFVSPSWAGVNIGFDGTAANAVAFQGVILAAELYAECLLWTVKEANIAFVSLMRRVGDTEQEYRGPLTGIGIYPHPMCEPVYIQFGTDLIMQNYVKTQFAGPMIHAQIIQLFKALEPNLTKLNIRDEGEFWETGDHVKLIGHFATIDELIRSSKAANPRLRGPIKIEDRFIDLMD